MDRRQRRLIIGLPDHRGNPTVTQAVRPGPRIRTIAVVWAAAAAVLAGCSTDPPAADPRIEAIFPPAPPDSVLYWEKFDDGKYQLDNRPPEIQRRWLVDCGEVDAVAVAIEQHFFDHDFVEVDTMTNGLNYRRESDGFTADVWTSRNPDLGSNNQFGLERDQIEGRCLVAANIQDTEYFDR